MYCNKIINSIKLLEKKILGLERKKTNINADIKSTKEYLDKLIDMSLKDTIETYKRRYPEYCYENKDNLAARYKYDIYGQFNNVIDPEGIYHDKVIFHGIYFSDYYRSMFIKTIYYDGATITVEGEKFHKIYNEDIIHYLTHYELLPPEEKI